MSAPKGRLEDGTIVYRTGDTCWTDLKINRNYYSPDTTVTREWDWLKLKLRELFPAHVGIVVTGGGPCKVTFEVVDVVATINASWAAQVINAAELPGVTAQAGTGGVKVS